ncbi:MAG: glycosyltransferase [Candidatus Binataceae bacterium]|nr:glycosyltransferase [Candidatus Binataceae bacterium]
MFGSSLVSAYWNGAATYYRGIAKALHERGHRVCFYEPDAYERQKHRDIPDPSWAEVVVYDASNDAQICGALERARRSDLVVKCSGVGVADELLEREIARMGDVDCLTAFWDVDAPATLDRIAADPKDAFRDLISAFDIIFTYGGGPRVVNAYTSLGARRCRPIYNAIDPITHYPVAPDGRFRADLSFLGNRLPDRELRVDEFFVKSATRLPGMSFLLGGNGWGDKPLPDNVTYLGHVYTRDHNAFNASALAVLNVDRASMAAYGYSPPTRIFEAAGAAACIISDGWDGIHMFLEPGREVLVARDGDEVIEILTKLSKNQAQKIGVAARKRILAEHTYQHRVKQIELALEYGTFGERRIKP